MPLMRRRPLLRAAAVGGGAYVAGPRAAQASQREAGQQRQISDPQGATGAVRRAWGAFSALYWGSGLCDDVPALAWFLLVSLVPLTLGLTALAALALGDYAEAQALAAHAARVLPRDVHDQLVQLILR